MTKAEEMTFSNLLENLDKVEKTYEESKNSEEANKIRQFAIDALTDYYDTEKKICALINKYRHLFGKDGVPYIKPSYHGKVNGKDFYWDRVHYPDGTFVFDKGVFSLEGAGDHKFTDILEVEVTGISGTRSGYEGGTINFTSNKDWVPVSITLYKSRGHYADHYEWEDDLFESEFRDTKGVSRHYTIDNLKNFTWSIDGWLTIKRLAEKTRLRTQELVTRFKRTLEGRIAERTKNLSSLENKSNESYVKVSF